MNFIKNLFCINRKGLRKANISSSKHDTNNTTSNNEGIREMTPNIHTRILNASIDTKIHDSSTDVNSSFINKTNDRAKVEPIKYVHFEERVNVMDEKSSIRESIPVYSLKEPKPDVTPVKNYDNTFECDMNKYIQSIRDSDEVCNNLSKNSLVPEFDETLSIIRKADGPLSFRQENLSLDLIDEFFGPLNPDNNCNATNIEENIYKNQKLKLLPKAEILGLNNTNQISCVNAKINDKANTAAKDESIDYSVEQVRENVEYNYKIIQNVNVEIEEIVEVQQNDTSLGNNEDNFKERSELKKQTYKEADCIDDTDSIEEQQTEISYNKIHINTNEQCLQTTEKHTNERNVNVNKNTIKIDPEMISLSSSDDENDLKTLNIKRTKTELDAIAITSTGENTSNTKHLNESYCSGYHSSDFEFITESEAEWDGIISNYEGKKERYSFKSIQINRDVTFPRECGSSGTIPKVLNDDFHARRNEVPQGDNYLNLFRGIYAPVMPVSAMYFLENKSVRTSSMTGEFEGIGFDMRMMRRSRPESSDDEFKQEGIETKNKILLMYSSVNRKRRRRN